MVLGVKPQKTSRVVIDDRSALLLGDPSHGRAQGRLDVTTSDGAIHPLVLAGRSSAPPVAENAADSLAGRWASSAALRNASREMATWSLDRPVGRRVARGR